MKVGDLVKEKWNDHLADAYIALVLAVAPFSTHYDERLLIQWTHRNRPEWVNIHVFKKVIA